jgi:hypothetical protein
MCLNKEDGLGELLKAFLYAGFEMVHPDVYGHSDEFVLLGYEV